MRGNSGIDKLLNISPWCMVAWWFLHLFLCFMNILVGDWRKVNQTQLSRAVASRSFFSCLFLNLSHSCVIILHFSTLKDKRKSMLKSVKSCHKYSVPWGFKVRDSLSQILQILCGLSSWLFFPEILRQHPKYFSLPLGPESKGLEGRVSAIPMWSLVLAS